MHRSWLERDWSPAADLSRWLQEARSLPTMADKSKPALREWTVAEKACVLAANKDGIVAFYTIPMN